MAVYTDYFIPSHPEHTNEMAFITGQCSGASWTGSVEMAACKHFVAEGKPADSSRARALVMKACPDSSDGHRKTTFNTTGLSFAFGYCSRISPLSTKAR